MRPGWYWFLAVLAGVTTAAETRRLAVPLAVDDSSSAVVRDGEMTVARGVPWQVPGSDTICLEAEDYWDIYWQDVDQGSTNSEAVMDAMRERETRRAYEDPAAAGGRYLERMTSVTWWFHVREAGTYTVWYRLFRPSPGNWVFQNQFRRHPQESVTLANAPGEWAWQKIGTYEFAATHQQLTIANFHNGKRLDKIVLHRDPAWTPEGPGPEPTPPLRNPSEASIVCKPFTPAAVTAWRRIDIRRRTDAGTVHADYSWDRGATWQALAYDGVPAVPAALPESLTVRLTLRPNAEGVFPTVSLPTVILDAPAAAYPELAGAEAVYTLNAQTGAISGIRTLGPGGRTLVPTGSETATFRVLVKPDDGQTNTGTWLAQDTDFTLADCDVTADRARFHFTGRDLPIAVDVTYALRPEGYLDAVVDVTNNHSEDVLEVEFPRLARARIGDHARDDTLLWPAGTGRKYPNPATQSQLVAYYPLAVCCYFDLYDADAGLYLAGHDPQLISTVLEAAPDESRSWMGFTITKRDRIRAGGGRLSLPLAIGAHNGTWHRAAQWYKAWHRTVFPSPDWPAWLAETNGWLFANVSFARPNFHYEQLPETVFRRAIVHGMRHIQVWGSDSFSSCPTYYYPPDDVGGPEAFAASNKWWADRGGHIGYYVLPQGPSDWFFSDDSTHCFGTPWADMPDWAVPPGKKEGKAREWALANARYDRPDRRPPPAWNNRWTADLTKLGQRRDHLLSGAELEAAKGTRAVGYPWGYIAMSSYSPEWQDWFVGWVLRYVRDWHTSTMYLDTMHTQAQIPDYNPTLGLHGDGRGGYWRSQMCKRIWEEGRKLDPDWLPIMEMQCDAYQPWMANQVGSSSMDSEMLKFTHPDHLQFEGQSGSGWGRKRFKRFSSCWLYGNRLDHREYEAWAVETIRLRRWVTRWLNDARFLDDLGLDVAAPELKAKIHRVDHADGSRGFLVNCWNTARREHLPDNSTIAARESWPDYRIRLDLTPMAAVDHTGTSAADWIPTRAILLDLGRRPRAIPFDVVWENGAPHVEYMLPARQLNGVLFVREAKGVHAVLLNWDQRDFAALDVHILNPGREPVSGVVTPVADGFAFPDTGKTYTAAPGDHVVVSFPYPDGRAPAVPAVVDVTVTMNDAARVVRAGAFPWFDDASFELDRFDGPYNTELAHDGRRSRVLADATWLRGRMEPATNYRMRFFVHGNGKAGKGAVRFGDVTKTNQIDGRALRFNHDFEYVADAWQPVEFTFRTPAMYHDFTMLMRLGRGNEVLLDTMQLEQLPPDTPVDHLPDHMMEM